MAEATLVWIDQDMAHSSLGAGTVELDLCDLGIVVLSHDGHVTSTNDRARELLRAESQSTLEERLSDLQQGLDEVSLHGSMDEMPVDVPGLGTLGVRSCAVGGFNGEGRVLL